MSSALPRLPRTVRARALRTRRRAAADRERAVHLHRLSKGADGGFTCRGGAVPGGTGRPTVRALLDRLEPAPAVLRNGLGGLLASRAVSGWDRRGRPSTRPRRSGP
ncbi:hypothetical protein GCM10009577_03870 [Streptomyces javensis]